MANQVHVVIGKSESGDDYEAVFESKPTKAQLSKLVHGWDGDENKDGPGYAGSYVHIEIKCRDVVKNTPAKPSQKR